MGSFHLHQEYSSTPIHHIILYYIVQIQKNLPERNSSSESTVASQLSLGPDLLPALRVVFTTNLDLAHYALYSSPTKNFLATIFPWKDFAIMLTPILRQFPYGPSTLLHVNLLYSSYIVSWDYEPTKLLFFCTLLLT
jgi:hypothetical protein